MLRLLLLALTPLAAPDDLDAIRRQVKAPSERTCREGTDACVQRNDADAAELLLAVLDEDQPRGGGLAAAHFRDVAWDGLARITDPYARARVADVAQKSKEPLVRQWCLELLGEYGDAELGDPVLRGLRDKDLGVQRAAARAAGRMRLREAEKALKGRVDARDPIVRANAIEALCALDPEAHRALLVEGLADDDAGVRCMLLGVGAERYPAEREAWSIAALRDEDWRPRLQAIENLGLAPTKAGIDHLVEALSDARPTIAVRARDELRRVTGQRHSAPEAWRAWWTAQRETFEIPDGTAVASEAEVQVTVAYHGVPVESDHCAFLIDTSAAMDESLASSQRIKLEAARDELEAVLERLAEKSEGKAVFQVYAYAEEVVPLSERKPLELTSRNAKKAHAFLEKVERGRSKDIWQVLERVADDPEIDTAFLLSSGEPDIGTYVHWNRVAWQLRERNRFHKLRVHTIVFSDSEWYREQLEKISEVTGGEHRAFE